MSSGLFGLCTRDKKGQKESDRIGLHIYTHEIRKEKILFVHQQQPAPVERWLYTKKRREKKKKKMLSNTIERNKLLYDGLLNNSRPNNSIGHNKLYMQSVTWNALFLFCQLLFFFFFSNSSSHLFDARLQILKSHFTPLFSIKGSKKSIPTASTQTRFLNNRKFSLIRNSIYLLIYFLKKKNSMLFFLCVVN